MSKRTWVSFSPTGLSPAAKAELVSSARRLDASRKIENWVQRSQSVDKSREREVRRLKALKHATKDRIIAAFQVLCDLTKQGWLAKISGKSIEIARPDRHIDSEQDRLRIRNQLQSERDAQLCQESVRTFVRSMEARRVWGGKPVSIFSLMRDGRDLAQALRRNKTAIDPYLQIVDGEEHCSLTGMRLVDIWRYFRHTWTTPYKSVPGRTMMVLVRDRAAAFHPVIGIAALSSATVGLSDRDEHLGWTTKQVLDRIAAKPEIRYGKWMMKLTADAVADIYMSDLLEKKLVTLSLLASPDAKVIDRLNTASRKYREEHYRFMQGGDYKDNTDVSKATDEYWEERATSLLFLSKRTQELANLLVIRRALNSHLKGSITANKIKDFAASADGKFALSKLIRKAKADRVGTVIADLTICGAVPPYNEILGGKLVAMLMASPEMVDTYRRRYRAVPSIIASSMAGRRIVRPSELVFISTTSLYGRRPNQYDRIAVPVSRVDPNAEGELRYQFLGKTRGIGTFQFGDDASDALSTALSQSNGGQRVNFVFGEGVNPRLRMLRDGLDNLGLPTNELLDHDAPRLVYGVSLICNLSDYLLGLDRSPNYYLEPRQDSEATSAIGRWWAERWLVSRVSREEVLDGLTRQTLVHPVRHAARVVLPKTDQEDRLLFHD